MNDCDCLNCELQAKWRIYYETSEGMVRAKFPVYREILATLQRVCDQTVDIDEYSDMAVRLSGLLEEMGEGTVFHNYFFEQIDPRRHGNVRHFRHLCLDLREQIEAFNHWRKAKRRLKVVTV